MKKYIIIILFFICYLNLFSQGFDWQWSARLPIENPKNYYGLNINYGFDYSFGNISFLENKINCPDFINANGNNIGIGINYTYWEKYNRYSIYGALRYNNFSISTYSIDNIPLTSEITAQYKISLDYNFNQADLLFGGNYKILKTHLLIGAGLNIGYIFTNNFTANEEILGPPEVPPFSTNPPSYKRNITSGELNEINRFVLKPHIKVSYDLQIGRGNYIEPNISITFPLWSMFSVDKINHYSLSFGVTFWTSRFSL